jgi:hypothetical protein
MYHHRFNSQSHDNDNTISCDNDSDVSHFLEICFKMSAIWVNDVSKIQQGTHRTHKGEMYHHSPNSQSDDNKNTISGDIVINFFFLNCERTLFCDVVSD